MKKIIVLFMLITCMLFHVNDVFAHQLIFSDGNNITMENALHIPDPRISWAMYGELEDNVLFYKFEIDQQTPFYASVVIPALNGLENFRPSLAIISYQQNIAMISSHTGEKNTEIPFALPDDYKAIVFDYDGKSMDNVFYEPFTQVNYWERQEVRTESINPGIYYLAVFDTDENGKFTLAVGEVEDFSKANFFDSFVRAWFETKIFFNDYLTASISIIIVIIVFAGIGYGIFRVTRRIIMKTKG